MIPLPFTLNVKGRDYSTREFTAWSTDKVHGLLHFDGTTIGVEWGGSSSIDEVSGLGVHSQTVEIPLEFHDIPLGRIRTARLTGGWLRPRLELTGNDLGAFDPVPGHDGGRMTFRIARRDRALAAQFVAALLQAARG